MTWRLAVRIARREAWRTRGRSLLVASMIALPVAGASAADTLWRSTDVSVAERATRTMGRYDALVEAVGGPLWQSPDANEHLEVPAAAAASPNRPTGGGLPAAPVGPATVGGPPAPVSLTALAALLPPGSEVTPFTPGTDEVSITKGTGRVWGRLVHRDLTDPLQAGMTRHRSGRPPATDDEAAVSTSELAALGKKVGDTIEIRTPGSATPATQTLRITGVYDLPDSLHTDFVFARPGVLGPDQDLARTSTALVAVPGGVSWKLVEQLNAHGFTAQSRQVLLHPPADSDVPLYTHFGDFRDASAAGRATTFAVTAIAASMVLLEIVLLAGPAFAVGARRRRRDFGLLGAAGADGKRLRRIVLADGVVLGAVGGVLGIAVGVLGSAAGYPWLSDLSSVEPGGFRVVPAELLAAGVVGVATGVIAALAPAITTSRQDVLQALTGRRGAAGTPWRLPLFGLAGIVVGTLLVCYGAFRSGAASLPIVAGIAIAELGVVGCMPVLVAWSGRLGRFLPLSGRLALRDGARNRGRTAPAVAAIMAAVAGASAVAVIMSTGEAKARAQYSTELRSGEAGMTLSGFGRADGTGSDVQQVADQVSARLPTRQAAIQYGPAFREADARFPDIVRTPANMCPYHPQNPGEFQRVGAAYRTDRRCTNAQNFVMHHLSMAEITAGGPELLRVLTGKEYPAAEAMLRQGGAVVFDPLDLTTPEPHATVTIAGRGEPHTVTVDGKTVLCGVGPAAEAQPGCPTDPDPTVTLPAAVVPTPLQGGRAIVALTALAPLHIGFSR